MHSEDYFSFRSRENLQGNAAEFQDFLIHQNERLRDVRQGFIQ